MPEPDSLLALLKDKVAQLARAARADGDVPPDALASAERLTRLAALERQTRPATPARWPIPALVLGTLLLVSLLLFLRVGETDIELELALSDVGFVLAHPQAVTGLANVVELRVAGVRDVQVTDPTLSQVLGAHVADIDALRIAPDGTSAPSTVTVSPITFPAGSEVRVSGGPGPADAVLQGGGVSLRVTVHGLVAIDTPGADGGATEVKTPKAILIETERNGTTLALATAEDATVALAPELVVEGLTMFRIDEFADDVAAAQPMSTILSGTLYFEALNGRARPLRPRELLRADGIRGVIRTLQLDGDRVLLNFRGRVQELRSGWSAEPANLMPTYLEWLQARHGLSLLWGTTLYVFGVAAAVLRWWRPLT